MDTEILTKSRHGDPASASTLRETIYDRLHALAEGYMRRERRDHTLGATELVHEAYIALVDQSDASWQDRNHFLSVAALAMRRVLVEHARRRGAQKRGGDWRRIALSDTLSVSGQPDVDLLDLDEALTALEELDARKARVVELRFFGGLTHEEAADTLGISPTTVQADWYAARAWLFRELTGKGETP